MLALSRLIAVACLLLGLSWDLGLAGAEPGAPELVQTGSQPRTDGGAVVWASGGVYVARAPDWSPEPVILDTPQIIHEFPDIDGDLVVWQEGQPCCGRSIRARNLATGASLEVAPAGYRPRIAGTSVLYQSGTDLLVRDLATLAAPVTVATAEPSWSVVGARISGDRVAWVEEQDANRIRTVRIMTAKLGQAPERIAESVVLSYFGIDLVGDQLVYVDGPTTIVALDLADGTRRQIPAQPYDQNPTTNGRYVFWNRIPGNAAKRIDIVGYDLASDSSFSVIVDQGVNVTPVLRDDILTWTRAGTTGNGATTIIARRVADLLPTAALPDPGTTDPNWLYFPPTGHYAAYGFKSFWNKSGGLPVFGYPVTEEFSETSPIDVRALTVQYFERQRFEYHPEHANTPYEVELGRLGVAEAQRLGLLGSRPFQPGPAPASTSGCTAFAETGHSLCGAFQHYWQTHGLEFSDPGVSFRESLALFGYPISEEFTDPASGLTVQYFERARFEWHPDNPAPYQVLLGRLGADLLAQRGW